MAGVLAVGRVLGELGLGAGVVGDDVDGAEVVAVVEAGGDAGGEGGVGVGFADEEILDLGEGATEMPLVLRQAQGER